MSESSPTTRFYEAANGNAEIYFTSPTVMVFRWRGAHSGDSADFMWKIMDNVIALGIKPNFYVDLENVTEVDSAFRSKLMDCVNKTRKDVGVYNYLIKSKILGMAVSVVNLGLGGRMVNKVYSTRAAFDDAIRRESGGILPIPWPTSAQASAQQRQM